MTLFLDTAGAATNSGSTDQNTANLSGSAATAAAAVVTLDGSPDLSALVTSGALQSTIALAQATNANRKIFKITAFDNSAKTVTLDASPSGIVSSGWAIGGRITLAGIQTLENALTPGDTLQVNNNQSSATALLTLRTNGDSTSGYIRVIGTTGAKRVLNCTSTPNCVTFSTNGNGFWFENIEFDQDGASGDAVNINTACVFYDCKVSDAGGDGFNCGTAAGNKFLRCEVSGVGAQGIDFLSFSQYVFGCYIHDVGTMGIRYSGSGSIGTITFSIIDSCGTHGFSHEGAVTSFSGVMGSFANNTVYGCNGDGVRLADADQPYIFVNNILKDNGDTGTEYNLNLTAGTELSYQALVGWNCYNIGGARGGGNTNRHTLTATEITTDPLFTNAAGGDFSLGSSSPCKATAFPGTFLGGTNLGYLDMGAVQRQEAGGGSSGALMTHPGMSGRMAG